MIIGITGGTGCGKTTALQAIRELGGTVIDCDRVYHDLLKTDTDLLLAIETRFPGTVEAGTLNRKALAGIVFSDPAALQALNEITHRAVKSQVLKILQTATEPVAIDAIGLFEGGLADLCHITVAITAPEEDRISRLIARDSITREQALLRIHAQKTEDHFRHICDYVLENNGTQQDFYEKCLVFFTKLTIIKEKP